MNATHPTAEQLDRYRRRVAPPEETLDVDAHIASCQRCFDEVRADAHLTFSQLEAVADGTQAPPPHLRLCESCRGEVADLQQMRQVLRRGEAPRRRWATLAAAAVLAIVLGATWMLVRDVAPSPAPSHETAAVRPPSPKTNGPGAPTPAAPPAPPRQAVALQKPRILETLVTEESVLRGRKTRRAFALHAPVATVVLEERPRFRWEQVAGATSYDVAVVDLDRGTIAASGECDMPYWQPNSPLPRGKTYAWQVAADTARGRVVSPGQQSPEARFHVATQSEVDGPTPLARGVALANLGALDDAERELESAGAVELLHEVRGWRGQRPLPTTTNGAQ